MSPCGKVLAARERGCGVPGKTLIFNSAASCRLTSIFVSNLFFHFEGCFPLIESRTIALLMKAVLANIFFQR